MRRKRLLALALLLLAALAPLAARAMADEALAGRARELTRDCRFEAGGRHSPYNLLTNGGYGRTFLAPDGALTVRAPQGESIAALYLCFREPPAYAEVQRRDGDRWVTACALESPPLHALCRVEPAAELRVKVPAGQSLLLDELRAFSPGALPEDAQDWRPTYDECDLLLLVAHPDDELIFFGGLVPWYLHAGKRVLVATMTCRSAQRAHEFLDAMWRAGLRHYPVIGDLTDRFTYDLDALYLKWPREEADYRFVQLVRAHRPQVVVTHSLTGEYGHAAHVACADVAARLTEKCGDPQYLPQLAHRLGVWQPLKLYLHQYPEHTLTMDWSRPVGSSTAAAIAREAFKLHRSQQHFHMQDAPEDLYCNAEFGLAYSRVGWDEARDDFFEHVPAR